MFDVLSIIKEYSYVGLFLIVFLESGIFFLLPGDSLLFAFGVLAGSGYVNIYTGIVCILVAAILGEAVGYHIGKYLEYLSTHKFLRKIFREDKILQTRDFFDKYGTRTIFLARFVPIVRTFAPILAGVSKMNKKVFWKYNVIGAIVWGAGIPLLGYVFGQKFPGVQDNLTLISVLIIVVTVAPVLVKMMIAKKK